MKQPAQRYISKELTHFVGRGLAQDEQYFLLLKILASGMLTHPPHDPNISGNLFVNHEARISSNEMYSPQIVCFCDIPIEDLFIHMQKYSPFGLSFDKDFIAGEGGAPVYYLPNKTKVRSRKKLNTDELITLIRSEGSDALYETIDNGEYFDRMIQEYQDLFKLFRDFIRQQRNTTGVSDESQRLSDLQRFLDFHVFSYAKFFDHQYADEHPDNYYFEREWRLVGNLSFSLENVKRIILPESYGERFRNHCPNFFGQLTYV